MEFEKDIERYLKKEIEKRNGLCWKFTSPGTSGVPDRVVICKGEVVFVELKKQNGVVSPIQKARIAELQRHGIWVEVLRTKWGVDQLCRLLDLKTKNWRPRFYEWN